MPNINFLKIEKIAKGLNIFSRDTMLTEEESAETTNVIATGQYSIQKRSGTKKLVTIAGGAKIDGMGVYYNGTSKHLLAMAGGKLYRIDTGTAILIGGAGSTWTAGLRTDFCQAGAYVFISNGTDTMRYYDGTNALAVTNGIICKNLIFYKGCLYALGIPGFASRLSRSGSDTKLGDFTYADPANKLATSINISNNDGQELVTFFKYQDYLYCAKNTSLFRIYSAVDATGTLSVELVDNSRGADSHWATDSVDNDSFIFNEMGVHSVGYEPSFLSQIRSKILSIRVDPRIKSIAKSALKNVCAIYFNNNYYMSYQQGGATANNALLVYDKYRLGFWEYDLAANCFCEFKTSTSETKLFFGSPTDGSIYYFDETAKADNGANIVSSWRSPKYSVSDYMQSKFILSVLLYMGRKVGKISVSVYVDGRLIISRDCILGNAGSSGIGVASIGTENIGIGGEAITADIGGSDIIKVPINRMGRNVQIHITDNNSTKSWELNAVEIALAKLNKLYQPGTR